MRMEAKAKELKDIVVLSMLKRDVTSKIQSKREMFNDALLVANNSSILVSRKDMGGAVNVLFQLRYNIDQGKIIEGGEMAIDLVKLDDILSSFDDEDTVSVYPDGEKMVFQREKGSKRKVCYTPPAMNKFGDTYRWTSPYKWDPKTGQLKKREEVIDTSYALVSPAIILEELKKSSFTDFEDIHILMKDGCMTMTLGPSTLYTETDLSGTVKGEVDSRYGVGFDNVFSVLGKYGGETDMVFIKPKNHLYVHHDAGKFCLEVILPSAILPGGA